MLAGSIPVTLTMQATGRSVVLFPIGRVSLLAVVMIQSVGPFLIAIGVMRREMMALTVRMKR